MTSENKAAPSQESGAMDKFLSKIEAVGNRIPDPGVLFIFCTIIVLLISGVLSRFSFDLINPATKEAVVINNLLSGDALVLFLTKVTNAFTSFAPLGIVLVAMLGVGVAEQAGMINTMLKQVLKVTPKQLLVPVTIFIAMISHVAADAGYILVVPLAGILFLAAGRHPILGIATAFVGVSGGFAANVIPCANDAILQSFTQTAARIIDPDYSVNILANYWFSVGSTIVIVLAGWWTTERIVAPRIEKLPLNAIEEQTEDMTVISPTEKRAVNYAYLSMMLLLALLMAAVYPESSAFRDANGSLTTYAAPLMQSIVPIIFIVFIIPGIVYGYITKKFTSSSDIMQAMATTFTSMSGFMVMVFFCAIFLYAFNASNMGVLIGVSGGEFLKQLALPAPITIVLAIIVMATINLFIGSASAKWALLSPILVPMLMSVGISPELTQAAFRVGDSITNIVTPLMVYFPLIVVYCRKYNKDVGVGSIISMMIPYTIVLFFVWTTLLMLWWFFNIPLGVDSAFTYSAPV